MRFGLRPSAKALSIGLFCHWRLFCRFLLSASRGGRRKGGAREGGIRVRRLPRRRWLSENPGGAKSCGSERELSDRANRGVQIGRAQKRNDVGRGPGSLRDRYRESRGVLFGNRDFGEDARPMILALRPGSEKNSAVRRKNRARFGDPHRDGTRQPAQGLKTPPGLRRAAFDITFPPTGSSSLPCQRRLRKLRGSTMPWRRFLLRSCRPRSAWSPEPNISYHGAQTTVKPSFSTRSRIFDLPLTLSPLSAKCRPWSLIYRPQEAVV